MSTSNSLECVVSEREYLSGSAKYKTGGKGNKKRRKKKYGEVDTACLEFLSGKHATIERKQAKKKQKKKNKRKRKKLREIEKGLSTSFQTYLRSVKYTVKNIRF